MLGKRLSDLMTRMVDLLEHTNVLRTYLDEVKNTAELLSREGFVDCPSFRALLDGARPPQPSWDEAKREKWPHG